MNRRTKFAKLSVGKNVVTAKQRQGSQEPLLPLSIALSGLPPISKVKVDYEPPPKNKFSFEVNGKDIYNLIKEEVDFDPSKTEPLEVDLEVNDKEAISGSMPWIIDDVDEKIQTSLGINQLTSLDISRLAC